MIHILHGEDIKSSYTKLNLLIKSQPNSRKIDLSGKETTRDQFINALSSQNLFDEKEMIIGHNLIKNKIVSSADIKHLSHEKEIVLWEDTQLTSMQLSKFKSQASIEIFKLPTNLFVFLDSIIPHSKQTFTNLQKLRLEKAENFCWLLSNRFFLLILAKNGTSFEKASELNGKVGKGKLFDWQWQKIKNQAYYFDLEILKSLFSGILKIDFMQKSGATNLNELTLVNILFFKYLKPQINDTIS